MQTGKLIQVKVEMFHPQLFLGYLYKHKRLLKILLIPSNRQLVKFFDYYG